MPLGATGRADLRKRLCALLQATIPTDGLSSDQKKFVDMTGLSTERLKKDWDKGVNTTSCNAFAQWVARQLEAKGVLGGGGLNLSGVEGEVPGSWLWANTGEAIEFKVHPLPGDFFCSSFPGQEWGHVGIVYDIDETTIAWKWVAGGQGGPKRGRDFIQWGPWLPNQAKTFEEARPKVVGWVDIGCYFFPNGPE